ncbi:hypothetical protein EYR40_000411 [Pleurotus pulmonarius]|nr:hypothetical protein EYR38_003660 [Pleurotus pulmonarius]KAF4608068.1 hypothetical protein EYR40_000411 [Pleurotus pulmonarius]
MKFSFATVVSLFLASQAVALPTELKDAEAVNAAHGCPNGNRATPLYRAFNPSVTDHFYTANAVEVRNARGYQQEGQAGRVFSRQESSTIPFYRLYSPSKANHFYTTNQWEADNAANTLGYNREGVAGYVFGAQICGSVPLYRLYQASSVNHFYTTNQWEADNAANTLGYTREGIAGYILQ